MQISKPTVIVRVCGVRAVSEVEAESPGGGTRSDVGRRTATQTAAVVAVDEMKRVDERTARILGGTSTQPTAMFNESIRRAYTPRSLDPHADYGLRGLLPKFN